MLGPHHSVARLRLAFAACMAMLLITPFSTSHAALSLNNTRVVFNSDKRNTSVVVRNPSKQTFAVQTWVNTAADDNTTQVPFLPSPQLFRLAPGKEQLLQINGLPNDLPTDRESLFFLNIQEIPQATEEVGNVLNVAMRTRIKMFYRPQQLKGSPAGQQGLLAFSLQASNGQTQLLVHNPTPFYFTFIRLQVNGSGQQSKLTNTEMLAPFAEQAYPLPGITPAADLNVQFSVINDYGGYTEPQTLPIRLTNQG